jgi:hypothetical protein
MPLIPGHRLTDDQRSQVLEAFELDDGEGFLTRLARWAFPFTRAGRLIVGAKVYHEKELPRRT